MDLAEAWAAQVRTSASYARPDSSNRRRLRKCIMVKWAGTGDMHLKIRRHVRLVRTLFWYSFDVTHGIQRKTHAWACSVAFLHPDLTEGFGDSELALDHEGLEGNTADSFCHHVTNDSADPDPEGSDNKPDLTLETGLPGDNDAENEDPKGDFPNHMAEKAKLCAGIEHIRCRMEKSEIQTLQDEFLKWFAVSTSLGNHHHPLCLPQTSKGDFDTTTLTAGSEALRTPASMNFLGLHILHCTDNTLTLFHITKGRMSEKLLQSLKGMLGLFVPPWQCLRTGEKLPERSKAIALQWLQPTEEWEKRSPSFPQSKDLQSARSIWDVGLLWSHVISDLADTVSLTHASSRAEAVLLIMLGSNPTLTASPSLSGQSAAGFGPAHDLIHTPKLPAAFAQFGGSTTLTFGFGFLCQLLPPPKHQGPQPEKTHHKLPEFHDEVSVAPVAMVITPPPLVLAEDQVYFAPKILPVAVQLLRISDEQLFL
ncbi:hypothetical protein BDK51DRAFT_31101, partial [Blyttiomyces helicus]